MLTVQLWSPDTCGCTIHQSFDDSLPPELVVISYVTREEAQAIHDARSRIKPLTTSREPQPACNLCPAHAPLGHTMDKYNCVVEENTRKNKIFGELQKMFPEITSDEYTWEFSSNAVHDKSQFRTCTVTCKRAMTPVQKTQLLAACATQFGLGKVSIS